MGKHGADKILFATDFPWHSPKNDSEYIKSIGLDDEALNLILYKNAVRLLGLEE